MKDLKYLILSFLLMGAVNLKSQSEVILSPDSLYNLGNAAYSNDQFDQAIFYYEKARLLDPAGKDININLQLANEQLSTDIIEIEPFFLADWWSAICNLMLPGGWKIISILFLIGLLVLIYFYYFKSKPTEKKVFYGVAGLLGGLILLSIFAGNTRSNHIFHSTVAIVFGNDQSLYQGPDIVSEKVKQVTGGNKLRVLDEDGAWYKVSAMDSEQGWIKQENVRLIKIEK